ncbi:MAG TPA: protein pufQ [Rhodobacteraceae bacterium]|jgi:hypothetical protein|nr:protein pufQ [Paracoccaceae bacterium]
MTDFASNGGHADHSHQTAKRPNVEFYTYFVLIFLAAVPFAAVAWIWCTFRDRQLPELGPFARAWREAWIVTPTIFRL